METRARKKFQTSPNFGFSAGGRVLSRGLCAMGAERRKMRAFHYAVFAFALLWLGKSRMVTSTNSIPPPAKAG